MSFLVAVAAGRDSADGLLDLLHGEIHAGRAELARHGPIAVAWDRTSRWVEAHDDGSVLVLLDGRIHHPSSPSGRQAAMVATRYLAMGPDVASGLLGDFVLIVMDRRSTSLVVARDPVGVRPWYVASRSDRLGGSSEVATLTSLPWVDTAVDEPVALEYLAARAESRGRTIYRGIGTLPPGETLLWSNEGERRFRHHTWGLRPDLAISWEDAAERCRTRLDESVASRLDGAATCELSGGLDSSAVVGTVARLGASDIIAARLLFEGPRADERRYSDAVLDRFGIESVSSPPWMPTAEEATELTRRLRRPLPDANYTMFVGLHRRLGERSREVSLTGLGGDDAFVASTVGSRVTSAIRLGQRQVVAGFIGDAVRHPRSAWPRLIRPTLHHLAPWKGDRLPPWVSEPAATRSGMMDVLRRRPDRVTGIPAIDERMANLTSGYDAWILEARAVVTDLTGRRETHPFLDPRLVEATYGLDPSWPVRGGHTRALQIEAYSDRLPEIVAGRQTKAEFSEVFWPQLLAEELLDSVKTGPLNEWGWLDSDGFADLIGNAREGKANAAIPLSRCVNLDRWLRAQ